MPTVVRTPEGNYDIPAENKGGALVPDGDLSLTGAGAQLGIGTGAVADSAAFEIESTTQGLRLPRMTTAQRDAIATPAQGIVVYNTTTNKLNFYTGAAWEAVTSA